eukprot:gb/GFBE01082515.1/.p1 GENE.gb/GFBE01082515.1/~~gb/GFBE01082515.1/.p1  ORF type:complete len:268 (+),score=33.74 gb/GFBE01082515.1/:1-804(+)
MTRSIASARGFCDDEALQDELFRVGASDEHMTALAEQEAHADYPEGEPILSGEKQLACRAALRLAVLGQFQRYPISAAGGSDALAAAAFQALSIFEELNRSTSMRVRATWFSDAEVADTIDAIARISVRFHGNWWRRKSDNQESSLQKTVQTRMADVMHVLGWKLRVTSESWASLFNKRLTVLKRKFMPSAGDMAQDVHNFILGHMDNAVSNSRSNRTLATAAFVLIHCQVSSSLQPLQRQAFMALVHWAVGGESWASPTRTTQVST